MAATVGAIPKTLIPPEERVASTLGVGNSIRSLMGEGCKREFICPYTGKEVSRLSPPVNIKRLFEMVGYGDKVRRMLDFKASTRKSVCPHFPERSRPSLDRLNK